MMPPSHSFVLLVQLIKRDVLLRYRGAMFGVIWIFINPLIFLAVITLIVGQVLQSPSIPAENSTPLWLSMYSGLIAFNIFSETVSRAPTSVRGYPSFVKKIIFPVHLLPLVPFGGALTHGAINLAILYTGLAFSGNFQAGALLYPVVLAPLFLLSLGLALFFSAWGVFIKDMTQIVPPFLQILFFLSPVLYSSDSLPPALKPLYQFNPLGVVIESCRAATIGAAIPWRYWSISLFAGIVVAGMGFAFFQRAREEFADVL